MTSTARHGPDGPNNSWYEAFSDPDGEFAKRLRSSHDTTHLQTLDEATPSTQHQDP
jgi:hypothetical protein